MYLKNLAIFSLIFMLLVLPGCTPSKDGGQEETGSKAPTEETTKAPEPAQKPEKDEHKAQLIEYAEKNLRQLQFVYAASGVDVTYGGSQIRYGFMDFSQDGKPELVAYASGDGEDAFFKIYYNEDGRIVELYTGHTGGFEGGFQGISLYEEKYYVFHESFSSSTGMEMGLMNIKNTKPIEEAEWYNVEEAKHGLNEETYALEGNLVNGVDVTEEAFEAYRENLSASTLTFDDFYSMKDLKKLS